MCHSLFLPLNSVDNSTYCHVRLDIGFELITGFFKCLYLINSEDCNNLTDLPILLATINTAHIKSSVYYWVITSHRFVVMSNNDTQDSILVTTKSELRLLISDPVTCQMTWCLYVTVTWAIHKTPLPRLYCCMFIDDVKSGSSDHWLAMAVFIHSTNLAFSHHLTTLQGERGNTNTQRNSKLWRNHQASCL